MNPSIDVMTSTNGVPSSRVPRPLMTKLMTYGRLDSAMARATPRASVAAGNVGA